MFDCHYDGDINRCDKDCKQLGECKRRTSGVCEHKNQMWNIQFTHGHCKDCGAEFGVDLAHGSAAVTPILRELLRLYDWRFELARMERDGDFPGDIVKLLVRYGREKKAAWEAARKVLAGQPAAPTERVLFGTDAYCPACGHNRDKSAVSTIDNEDGTNTCQMCEAVWREIDNQGGKQCKN